MTFSQKIHTETATIAAALRELADQLDKTNLAIAPTHVSVSIQVLSTWPTPSQLRAEAVEDIARALDVDHSLTYRYPGEIYGTLPADFPGTLAVQVFGIMPTPGDTPEMAA